jgi:hypothetical protein
MARTAIGDQGVCIISYANLCTSDTDILVIHEMLVVVPNQVKDHLLSTACDFLLNSFTTAFFL